MAAAQTSQTNQSQGHQPSAQQQQDASDPIYKVKMMVPQLKEALSNLMRMAAAAFQHSVESESKLKEDAIPRFDKSLEDFYQVCDQIEINLKLAQECAIHASESSTHTPRPLVTGKQDLNRTDTQSYSQLISTVKTQISCAQEVHDILMECSRKLGERK